VPPGNEVTFSFAIPAPTTPAAAFQWQLLQEGREWFGTPSNQVQITLIQPALTRIEPSLFKQEAQDQTVDVKITGVLLRGATTPGLQGPFQTRIVENTSQTELRLRVTVLGSPRPQPGNEPFVVWVAERTTVNVAYSVDVGGVRLTGACSLNQLDWKEKRR
jgi:hypothetical protein